MHLSYSFLGSPVTSPLVQMWQPTFIKSMKAWVYGMVSQDFSYDTDHLFHRVFCEICKLSDISTISSCYLLCPSSITAHHPYCLHFLCHTARTMYVTSSLEFCWRCLVIIIRYVKPGTVLVLAHGSQVFQNLAQVSSTEYLLNKWTK